MCLAAGLRPLQPMVTITIKTHLGHSLCWEKDCPKTKVVKWLIVILVVMVLKTGLTLVLPQTSIKKQLKVAFNRNAIYIYYEKFFTLTSEAIVFKIL